MRNLKVIIPVALAALTSLGAQANSGIAIQASTQVDCVPRPSIATLDKETVYENGKPAFTRLVTCSVADGQAVPMQSKFFGHLVAGPALNTYSFDWGGLQIPGPDGSFAVGVVEEDEDLSSVQNGSDGVRVTFKRGLSIGPFDTTK